MDLNKKHLLYLIVFFLFGNLNAFGQSINISGRILSQGTQDAVEYANIVLFKQDSIFLQGTTSDSIGRFEFMNLSPNDYVLSVSCMGFEPKKIVTGHGNSHLIELVANSFYQSWKKNQEKTFDQNRSIILVKI